MSACGMNLRTDGAAFAMRGAASTVAPARADFRTSLRCMVAELSVGDGRNNRASVPPAVAAVNSGGRGGRCPETRQGALPPGPPPEAAASGLHSFGLVEGGAGWGWPG